MCGAKRACRIGHREFHAGRRQNCRPHRHADSGCFRSEFWIAVEHAGQRGRNRADAACEETVGAAEHRIGFVDDRGNAEQLCCNQRRQRRIAAEADHCHRLELAHQMDRDRHAGGEQHASARQRQRKDQRVQGAGQDRYSAGSAILREWRNPAIRSAAIAPEQAHRRARVMFWKKAVET